MVLKKLISDINTALTQRIPFSNIINTYDDILTNTNANMVMGALASKTGFNSKVSYHHLEVLWTGSLAAGKSSNTLSSNWSQYILFGARTSDGATMMLGMRYVDEKTGEMNGTIRFVGALDNGTSYVFKSNVELAGTTIKCIATSRHRIYTSGVESGSLNLVSLIGLM